jgi:hypothetical protein
MEVLYDDDDGELAPLKDDEDEDEEEDNDEGLETAFGEYDFDAEVSALDDTFLLSGDKVGSGEDDGSEDATGGEWLFSPTLAAEAYAFQPLGDGGVTALLGRWPGAPNYRPPEATEAAGAARSEEEAFDAEVNDLWATVQSGALPLGELRHLIRDGVVAGDCSQAQASDILKRIAALAKAEKSENKAEKADVEREAEAGASDGFKVRTGPALRREPWDPACSQVRASAGPSRWAATAKRARYYRLPF